MKRVTIILIKVKSCNALLIMLLVCICSYQKSVLRYKLLILNTYHPDTLNLHEQGCENPWLFFETKRGPPAKTFGKWSRVTITYSSTIGTVGPTCAFVRTTYTFRNEARKKLVASWRLLVSVCRDLLWQQAL